MKFLSCKDEGSILVEEHEPTEKRALLTTFRGPVPSDIVVSQDAKPLKLRIFNLSELESATGGFAKANQLGKGSHGRLYKGTLKDGRLVAVKRQEFLQDEAAFNNELEILSTFRGPRFVNLLGFSRGLAAQERLLVVDFMANGTLCDILHGGLSNNSSSGAPPPTSCSSHTSVAATVAEPLGWSMRVQIALQTAKALLALHSATPPVIHRDVKSSSVFIDNKWNAKLGDFGLALRGRGTENDRQRWTSTDVGVAAAETSEATSARPGGCTDPEDDTPGSRISTKVDVFSFGILLLELLSGRNAIDVRYKPPSIVDWALPLIKQGKFHAIFDRRLVLPPHYAKPLRLIATIAARCVRRCSLRRPSMNYVVAALQDVSKKLPIAKWADSLASVMKMTTSGCQTPHILRDVRGMPDSRNTNYNHLSMSIRGTGSGGPRTPAQAAMQRLAVDKPLPSGKGHPLPPPQTVVEQKQVEQDYNMNAALSRVVSRAGSTDRPGESLRSRESRLSSTRMSQEGDFVILSETNRQCRHLAPYDEDGCCDGDGNNDETLEFETEDEKDLPRATMEVSMGGRKRVYNQWRNPIFDMEGRSPERAIVLPMPTNFHRGGLHTGGLNPVMNYRQNTEDTNCGSAAPPPRQCDSGSPSTATSVSTGAPAEDEQACVPTLPLSISNKVRSRNVRSSSRKSHVKTRDNFEREEAMLPW